MTKDSDWATPKVMGRPLLLKPPLLVWFSALSLRLFKMEKPFDPLCPRGYWPCSGRSSRLFGGSRGARPEGRRARGDCAPPFLAEFHTDSRLCLTDILASSFTALALACVAFDPRFVRRQTRVLFAILGAASILAKSVAGALPFVTLFLFWMVLPGERKPKIATLAEIALVASGILAPWYIYQGHVHPQWLWAENIQGQLLGTGLHWDRNSVIRSLPIVYYLRRLIEMDPVLLTFACAGLAGVFRSVRSRQRPAALLAVCWAAITVVALCAFQAANLPYVTLLLPPLCVLGGLCGPRLLDRYPAVTASALAALLLTKAAASGQPWSLRPAAPPLAGAKAIGLTTLSIATQTSFPWTPTMSSTA